MVVKKKAKKKRDPSWDQIGKSVGKKIEKASNEGKFDCKSWDMKTHCNGGGFGRLLFIIGAIWILNTLGHLDGVSNWAIALIIIGFAFMKF